MMNMGKPPYFQILMNDLNTLKMLTRNSNMSLMDKLGLGLYCHTKREKIK